MMKSIIKCRQQFILIPILLTFVFNGGLIYPLVSSFSSYSSINVLALKNDASSIANKQTNDILQNVKSLDLGKPIYQETYFVPPNDSDSFSGNGTLYGMDVVVATGNATFISKSNNTVLIEGNAQLATKENQLVDVAPYTFHSLGLNRSNDSFAYIGIAFFEPNATGKLSVLGNTIGVYKGETMADGHGTFVMWKFE